MADNVTLNAGSGGSVVRTVNKAATSAQTQIVILDVGGGADGSPETPWTGGVSQFGAWTTGRTWTLSSSGDSVAAVQSGAWSVSVGGTVTVAGAVTVSNLPATQAISAASLPLPTGAAQEVGGNLAAVAGAAGAVADAAYAGSGSSSIIAALKGIYAKLAGTLTATVSGSVAVTGTFWQATQPVSLTALPALTAGSATIGNVGVNNNPVGYAALATSQASISTSSGSTIALAARTGAAGTGRGAVIVYNMGANTAYIGASGVTSSTGIPILPGGSLVVPVIAALYAVTASNTTTLAFMEVY